MNTTNRDSQLPAAATLRGSGSSPARRARRRWGLLLGAVSLAAMLAAPISSWAVSTTVVISQVYGGGGNASASYQNDFIELHNVGCAIVNLTGMSVQYASAASADATAWSVTPLNGSIPPGGYYLVQEAGGANGLALPTPDATGSINLNAAAGKVALVNSTTALSVACPSAASIVDLVGYGTGAGGANCSETTAITTISGNATAAVRNGNGCTDTDNNATDFTRTAPNPRNNASPVNMCETVAPQLGCTLLVANANGAATAVVTYTIPATDNTDPSPVVVCNPPSGSSFPVGSTTVHCTATDGCGNVGQCDFLVAVAKETFTMTDHLPPDSGQYVSPEDFHVALASGILITNVSHNSFISNSNRPAGAAFQAAAGTTESFSSTVECDVSLDNGMTFTHISAPAQVTVHLDEVLPSPNPPARDYNTEMLQLDLQGGNLPPGFMLRESPTLQSLGHTTVRPLAGGGFGMLSFFDIFTEISLDGGVTWEPALTAAPMTLQADPPEVTFSNPNLPPQEGQYVSPQQFHTLAAQGIVLTDPSHDKFSQSEPPPPLDATEVHTFNSRVRFHLNGSPVSAPALCVVQLHHSSDDAGGKQHYDTEMLSLDISGGGLPAGVMIRESPTRASTGKTTIRPLSPMGPYAIGSFFDVFIEVSIDGGATWSPAADPLHMQAALADITPPTITCPPGIIVTASGPAGAVVTYTVTATDDTDPSPSIVCNPPSGSTFPVGLTVVICTATDASGNTSNCAFDVVVNPPVGDPCSEPDNGHGTVTLPPPGCEYLSPDQVHMIIDGLPPGTTIELAVIHKNFICHDPGAIGPCADDCFSTDLGCDPSNGATEQFNSTLQLHLHGTGALAGWDRDITISNVACQSQVGPRLPGTSPQSFDTDMQSIQGQLPPGDPDFDLLRITAGSGFGLPSPGHTTLTVQGSTPPGPGASWAVDSFFDITYRIDFVGNPVGALGGHSGSTTGTIRMVAVESFGISCPNSVTVPATDPTGAVVDYPAATTVGGCSPVTVLCNPPSGSVFPVGTTTVTCTAIDACNRTATCTFTVVVAIAPPVIITSPASQTVECGGLTEMNVVATGIAPLSYQWRHGGMPLSDIPGEVSGSTTPTLRINHTRSSDAGSYDVVVSNPGGSTTSDAADLTLGADTHPPSITCPSDITTTASSVSGVVVTFAIPSVTDACDPAPTSQCTPPSGSTFPLGTTTVTCTARDASMHESSCSFHIRVITDLTLQAMVDATPANGTLIVPARATDYDCVTITKNIHMIADGVVVVHGCSPAITVSAGTTTANGFIFVTATPDPTVLVNGTGALQLRNCVVQESTHATGQPGIRVLNTGSMDLGTPGDPGLNTININGVGSLIDNSAPNSLPALGNTWQNNTVSVTDGFALEDRIYHALDALFVGLVRYQAGNVYVTINSSSIQRGIDAASTGDIVNVQSGTYTVDSANATAVGKDITLAPGASPGQVILNGNLTLDAGDSIAFELNGTTPGTDYDQLVVNGTVTLGGAALSATAGFGYADCSTLTLIDNNASDPVSGTFAGLPNGATVVISGQSFKIFYDRGSGNDVVLIKDTVAPAINDCLADFPVGTDPGTCSAVVNYITPTALDNCDGPVAVVCTPASGSTFPVGTTPVVCTAIDSVGNSSTCPFSVIVIDAQPPSIVCPGNITQANDPNQCSAVVTFASTATDNCGATVACVPASGSTFSLGTTTVTCTAIDGAGNTAACSFTVTVNDTQPPVASCPTNISVPNDPNSCSAVVNYTASASDNCDIGLQVRIYSGFSATGGGAPYSSLVGTFAATGVSFATDTGYSWHPFGLTDFGADITGTLVAASAGTYSFTLNSDDGSLLFIDGNLVVDNGDPHAPDITSGSAVLTAGTHTFEVQFFECCGDPSGVDLILPAGVTYGTGSATIACAPPTGATFPLGTTAVNCTATDAAGNTTPCSFTVTVNDTQPPTLTCPPDITVANDAGQCSAVLNYTATAVDNCDSSVLVRIYSGHGTVGSGAPYSGLVDTFSAPGISFGTDTGYNWHPSGLGDFGADITGTLVVAAAGTYSFTLGSDDGSLLFIDGNLVVDDGGAHPPLGASGSVALTAGGHSFEVQFYEDFGGESGVDLILPPGVTYGTPVVCAPPSGSTFAVGTTPVNCTATDAAGNTGTCSFTVTVSDTQPPVASCPANIVAPNDPGECSAVVTFAASALDNCPGAAIACVPASGSAFPVGSTAVTCIATDAAGNTSACGFTVAVSDAEAPVANCPLPIIVPNDPNQCSAVVTYAATASDNCPGASIVCVPASGSAFVIGTTTVNCTATDAAGLTATCSFTVTVNDTQAPVANCPLPITVPNDAGRCDAVVNYTATASDNCDSALQVRIYSGFTPTDGGAPYSGLVGTFSAPAISFATDTGFDWHPFGLFEFGADITGTLVVASSGTHTFTLNSDDGSLLFIDGNLVVDNGDPHGPGIISGSAVLTAGTHTFEVQFFECCGGPSGVDLVLPAGVTYSTGSASVVCVPPSGSTFPVGATTVNCTATDAGGLTGTCSFSVTVNDTEPPVIGTVTATQGGDVKNCAATVLQGDVIIQVTATDQCPLATPTVVLVNGANTESATFVNESPAGTFNYKWTVSAATPGGTWTATVTATDAGGNTDTESFTLCVNPCQITGLVQLESFIGTGTIPLASHRVVTFKATDGLGVVLKTWTLDLTFTVGTAASGGVANYTLTDVPVGTVNLSAKTDWNKRRRLAVAPDPNCQGVVNFTGATQLAGGDIGGPPVTLVSVGPPDNVVNLADYSLLVFHWLELVSGVPAAAVADMNGDGAVNIFDYGILGANWFTVGDPE